MRQWCVVVALVAVGILVGSGSASGTGPEPLEEVSFNVLPLEEVSFNLYNPPTEAQVLGKILNLTGAAGQVTVALKEIEEAATVAPGFVLLDLTMAEITAPTLGAGRLRALVRKAATPRIADRARVRGYRAKDLVLMARKRRTAPPEDRVWRACSRVTVTRQPARIRRIEGRPDFILGHYGVYQDTGSGNTYVWAVVDTPGQFAIGVPEPATLSCLLLGGAALLAARRRKAS